MNSSFDLVSEMNFYALDIENHLAQQKEQYISVDDVRIIPPNLIFRDAYDGKEFQEKFQIMNTGAKPAFVRFLAPSSKTFRIKPLPKGCYLAAGMSINRIVKFRFNNATSILKAYFSIYINEKPILYNIDVFISRAVVRLSPKILNFGEIDIGTASEAKSIYLNNFGQKSASFIVDLGSNDLELIVQPRRGIIQPNSTKEITVEILGVKEGKFLKEFWVKTEPPQRIRLLGKFIQPGLITRYPLSKFRLHLIDFPKTYYGAITVRTVIIENCSSQPTMFCSVAEYKGEVVKLDKARQQDLNLQCFYFKAKEGRLLSKRESVMAVYFCPKKIQGYTENCYIAFVRVNKVDYRDGIVQAREMEVKTFSSNIDLDAYTIVNLYSTQNMVSRILLGDTFVRLCFYGETEEASVTLTPDAFRVVDLFVGEVYTYTFNVKNDSNYLPIICLAEKVACIELNPSKICLGPSASLDVSVLIRPSKMGSVQSDVKCRLIYTNEMGKSFDVGKTVLRVSYTANYKKKENFKSGTALCYPSSDYQCEEKIFQLIRTGSTTSSGDVEGSFYKFNESFYSGPVTTDAFQFLNEILASKTVLNDTSQLIKTITANKRKSYARVVNKFLGSRPAIKELTKRSVMDMDSPCHVTNPNNLIDVSTRIDFPESIHCLDYNKLLHVTNKSEIIPLPPENLMDIEVTPKYIELGKIAPFTSCTDYFSIENKNDFSIRISIKALNNTVVIKGKKTIKIASKKKMRIYFDCFSHGLGKYYVPVYIIVNECHIFDATVFADIVPCIVTCSMDEIEIDPKTNTTYVEVHNPVNCEIQFRWEVQDENYEIVPIQGVVPPRRSIYCKLSFIPMATSLLRTEIYLISQTEAKQIIKVVYKNEPISVVFNPNKLCFNNIPLNTTVTKYLTVINFSEKSISVFIENNNPATGISITPRDQVMYKKSELMFKVSVNLCFVGKFKYLIKFRLQNEYTKEVEVSGTVTLPKVDMKPAFIQIPKIPAGAFVMNDFVVTNNGNTATRIKFPMMNFEGVSISRQDYSPMEEQTSLEPNESMNFILNFAPQEPVVYSFYIPYVLNDLIGPPKINDCDSMLVETYFQPPTNDSACISLRSVRSQRSHTEISVVRVRCAAGAAWLKFSSLDLQFKYGGVDSCEQEFSITNVSNVKHRVKLLTSYVTPPFHLKFKSCDGDYKEGEGKLIFYLESQQAAVVEFSFSPESYGNFRIRAPIFVKAFSEKKLFNYLDISGDYLKPLIKFSSKFLPLPTISVKSTIRKVVYVTVFHHKKDCTLSATSSSNLIAAEIHTKRGLIWVTISFSSNVECYIVANVDVCCTCNITNTLEVRACVDNCSIFSYETTLEEDGVPSNVKSEMESWLHSQGFFCGNYFEIPSSISRYSDCGGGSNPKMARKTELPLVQLFINVIDRSVANLFSKDKQKGTTFKEQTIKYYQMYTTALEFLEENEVYVQQARPEYLLPYENYEYFKQHITDPNVIEIEEILSEDEYNRYSTICWTSLVMKFFKKFAFDRVLESSGSDRVTDTYYNEFMKYFNDNVHEFPEEYNKNEAKLLLWMEYHYKLQINKLPLPLHNDLVERKIRNFNVDLDDSLPIITLVLAYCPYTRDFFGDVYTNAEGGVKKFHNACVLRETLKKMKLSIRVEANYKTMTSELANIVLLAYLYDVLPGFYPSQNVCINANVGETGSYTLHLRNPSRKTAAYNVLFFNNNLNEFTINQTMITMSPQESQALNITYSAKTMNKVSAVLILSGETSGYKYAKSKAYQLVGIPDIYYHVKEYKFNVYLYETFTKTIQLHSPCGDSYLAETYIYFIDHSKTGENFEKLFLSADTLSKRNVPTQIKIDEFCDFDEEGNYSLKVLVCSVCYGDISLHVYFLNNDIGIFSIKLTFVTSLKDDLYEAIPVKLTSNFGINEKCKCKTKAMNLACPLVIFVDIPCRNNFLMKGLKELFETWADVDEVNFWNKHLVFPKGFPVLKAYLENTFEPILREFEIVLSSKVEYTLTLGSNRASIEKSCTINNVNDAGTVRIPIHWNANTLTPFDMLTMKAQHGKELRKYKLIFPSLSDGSSMRYGVD